MLCTNCIANACFVGEDYMIESPSVSMLVFHVSIKDSNVKILFDNILNNVEPTRRKKEPVIGVHPFNSIQDLQDRMERTLRFYQGDYQRELSLCCTSVTLLSTTVNTTLVIKTISSNRLRFNQKKKTLSVIHNNGDVGPLNHIPPLHLDQSSGICFSEAATANCAVALSYFVPPYHKDDTLKTIFEIIIFLVESVLMFLFVVVFATLFFIVKERWNRKKVDQPPAYDEADEHHEN